MFLSSLLNWAQHPLRVSSVEANFPPNTELVELHTIDLLDSKALDAMFAEYEKKGGLTGVIHLAVSDCYALRARCSGPNKLGPVNAHHPICTTISDSISDLVNRRPGRPSASRVKNLSNTTKTTSPPP